MACRIALQDKHGQDRMRSLDGRSAQGLNCLLYFFTCFIYQPGPTQESPFHAAIDAQAVDIGDSQYLSAVGTAINTSVRNVEAIVIPREHWERCSQPQDESEGGMKKVQLHFKLICR